MNRNTKNNAALLPLIALGALGIVHVARAQETIAEVTGGNAQAIQTAPVVTVNGQTVQFFGQPPVEQGGRVLVPLRGVLEKLGAFVQYDAPTKTITAFREATRITLPVGSRQALVNDRSVALDAPAQILNGSTLVPLRFVAESLGAQVNFDYRTRNVAINTSGNTNPAQSVAGGAGAIASGANAQTGTASSAILDAPRTDEKVLKGQVVSVFSNVVPRRLVVRVPNANNPNTAAEERTIPLRDNAHITQRRPMLPPMNVSLSRVHIGDTVEIRQTPSGVASAIVVTRRASQPVSTSPDVPVRGNENATATLKGEFLDFTKAGNKYILKMTDGRLLEVQDDVPTFYDGQRASVDDLRSGDQLTIAVDPKTKRGTRIVIAPEK